MLCKELETLRRLPSLLLLLTLFFTTTTPNGDDPHKNEEEEEEEEEEGAKAKVPPRHFPACSISPAISAHQIPSPTSNPTNYSTQTSYAGTQFQKPTTQKATEPLKRKNWVTELTHPTKTKLECV
jgi:hypothetical protein